MEKNMNMKIKDHKEEQAKEYGEYVKQFTPRPNYLKNSIKAFVSGGALCIVALWVNNLLVDGGMKTDIASTWVTAGLIALAQLLTGFGIFDLITKWAGAGIIVPITGFANSMVAPAIEYKKEGLVLGVGSKMFGVAGPVLVLGFVAGTLTVLIRFFLGMV